MATNGEVARAWRRGEPAMSAHMHTDGRVAYSYGHRVGETGLPTNPDVKIAYCCHYSMTTAHHCSEYKRVADIVDECMDHPRQRCAVNRAS